jgi:hypothetical protein
LARPAGKSLQEFQDYYNGNHRLAFATEKFRQTFGLMFKALSVNWCESAVDVAVDRLKVQGFRFGPDQEADSEAWEEIWQANSLDAGSIMLHTEAGKSGRAYVMVDPNGRVTIEHPQQMVVAHAAGDRASRIWAFKRWHDEDGFVYAILYLPDRIEKFRSTQERRLDDSSAIDWDYWPEDEGERHSLGVVPVVPFYNKPDIRYDGRSDLLPAMPIQDAIDKEVADMLVASEFAAFPQRVLTGIEVPTDDNGTPTSSSELKAAIGRLWVFENENAKVSEFKAADLNNYVVAITSLLQQFAAITRTPPHYLLGQVVNASGDALKAAEAGLASKVERKQIDFSDSWEEVIRLGFKAKGNSERASEMSAETIWAPAEKRTEAEMVDAAQKLKAMGLPIDACWEYVGFSPQQIERFKKLRDAEPEPPAMPPVPPSPEPPAPEVP